MNRPYTTNPHASARASARAILTLALAARGLIEVIDSFGDPWARLVKALLLTVLALGFFAAAQRSRDHRSGWMLSGGAAAGLLIAAFYSFIDAAVSPAVAGAALAVCIVGLRFITRGAARHRTESLDLPAAGAAGDTRLS